jgi:hypothetical protein
VLAKQIELRKNKTNDIGYEKYKIALPTRLPLKIILEI